MYAEYEDEIKEEDLLYGQSEQTSDIQLPPIINTLLLVTWTVIFLLGFVVIYFAKSPLLGALIIAIPTFIGMVIKPTFALCMMMLVLPTGAGVGIPYVFSLDHGVGIALAVSFLLNLMVSRPSLHIRNNALWVLVIYTIWIFFSSLTAPHVSLGLQGAFTHFQLLVLVFIVYWILQTNGEKTFRWALRAYVIGTLGTIITAYISGAAIIATEEASGRYTATLGYTIDANMLSALTSMAFLAAIYLFARDRNILWRIVHLTAILLLPVMLLRMGSRGALVALTFTMLSPLLFVRQVLRRPALAALLLLVIVFASGSAAFFVQKHSLEQGVSERLTNIQRAKESLAYRITLMKKATEAAAKWPAGTSYSGWFERAGIWTYPHSDFFFALGIYGIPGAILFLFFLIITMLTVKRMPLGLEKIYARAALTFLLVNGLSLGQILTKYYWIFLAIIIATERISRFHISENEYELVESDEETTCINY
jgi:O-antigen ligase